MIGCDWDAKLDGDASAVEDPIASNSEDDDDDDASDTTGIYVLEAIDAPLSVMILGLGGN